MEEATKRIHICGYEDVTSNIENLPVGQVMVARDIKYKIDYKGVKKHVCYTPNFDHCLPPSEQQANLHAIEADLDLAESYLETNQDDLLIHCAGGTFYSPSFTFLLLLHLQGETPDLYKAGGALLKIKPDSSLFGGMEYVPYIPAEENEIEKFIQDYRLAKKVIIMLQTGNSVAYTFRCCAGTMYNHRTPEEIVDVCAKFGFELPTNIALCDASSDRQGQPPSSLRKPGFRGDLHTGRGGPS